MYYKLVDEPIVASAYMRAIFVNVRNSGHYLKPIRFTDHIWRAPVGRYIPYGNLNRFFAMAEENRLRFLFDYEGTFLEPGFDQIPIIVFEEDVEKLDWILSRINEQLFEEHSVRKGNLKFLDQYRGVAEPVPKRMKRIPSEKQAEEEQTSRKFVV